MRRGRRRGDSARSCYPGPGSAGREVARIHEGVVDEARHEVLLLLLLLMMGWKVGQHLTHASREGRRDGEVLVPAARDDALGNFPYRLRGRDGGGLLLLLLLLRLWRGRRPELCARLALGDLLDGGHEAVEPACVLLWRGAMRGSSRRGRRGNLQWRRGRQGGRRRGKGERMQRVPAGRGAHGQVLDLEPEHLRVRNRWWCAVGAGNGQVSLLLLLPRLQQLLVLLVVVQLCWES